MLAASVIADTGRLVDEPPPKLRPVPRIINPGNQGAARHTATLRTASRDVKCIAHSQNDPRERQKQAFHEFFRVSGLGGRVSIFEPMALAYLQAVKAT